MKKIYALLTLIPFSFFMTAAQAENNSSWGAVACSPTVGQCSYSNNSGTQAGAENEALNQCLQKIADDCQMDVSFDDQCIAVAHGNYQNTGKYAFAWEMDLINGVYLANGGVQECDDLGGTNCAVILQFCSEPSSSSPAPTPPPPTGLSLSGDSPSNLLATWHSGGGTTSSYRVNIAPGTTAPRCNASPVVGTPVKNFTSLAPNTTYSVSVCALNAQGAFSFPVSATGKTAAVMTAPLNFGGAFGYVKGVAIGNPATGAATCPSGYTSQVVLNNPGTDYPVVYCFQSASANSNTVLDFGGFFGYVNGVLKTNPLSGTAGCPKTFSPTTILGTPNVDYALVLCSRPHVKGSSSPFLFGGLFGQVYGANLANPATGAMSCPVGYTSAQIYGTPNVDYSMWMCYR